MPELEAQTLAAIRALARANPLTPELISNSRHDLGLEAWNERRVAKAILRLASSFRTRGNFGKLRAAVLAGITWYGEEFLRDTERAGVLLADRAGDQGAEFARFLGDLKDETEGIDEVAWRKLHRRLNTYLAYQELSNVLAASAADALRLFQNRPRLLVRMALVVTALSFLGAHFQFEVPERIAELIQELGGPEEIASITSFLVVLANEHGHLDSLDFAFLGESYEEIDELRHLMIWGKAMVEQLEVAKYLSLFGYELEVVRTKHLTFCLRPPSPEFEYSMRLGYIRAQTNAGIARLDVAAGGGSSVLSLRAAAERFAERFRSVIAEVRDGDTEWRRLRLNVPSIPKLFQMLKHGVFHEDLLSGQQLSRDFLVPLRSLSAELKLTKHLDLKTFIGTWRYLQFIGLVEIALLRSYAKDDPLILLNSLVRVIEENALVELLEGLKLSQEQGRDFIGAISTDVTKPVGYLDLQYKPGLRIAQTPVPDERRLTVPELIYVPALVVSSNIERNVQSAHNFRIELNARAFVDFAARTLKARFSNIETNRPVKGGGKATDIDVVILEKDALYLFECKHSLPPTGPHEMRDIWEEIEKGVHQLETAAAILNDPARRQSYLTGWFPGTKLDDTSGLKIVACVLCSHRLFSGLEKNGIAIRDFSSLARLCDDGVMGMGGDVAEDEVVLRQYRIIRNEVISASDLADYCSADSVYFKMFKPFLHPVTRFERLGDVTIAKETFVYEVGIDDWGSHLESLGAVRVADRHQKVKLSFTEEGVTLDQDS
jgi:hypothetical protein